MLRLLLTLLLSLALALPALGAELKVGHFDLQRVLGQSEAGKQAREKYLQKAESFQQQINQRTEELNRLKAQIEERTEARGQNAPPSAELIAMNKDAAGQFRELQRLLGGYQDELKLYDSELTRELLLRLQPVLGAFAEQHHYDYLFKIGDGLAYVSHKRDVTDALIESFDQAYVKSK